MVAIVSIVRLPIMNFIMVHIIIMMLVRNTGPQQDQRQDQPHQHQRLRWALGSLILSKRSMDWHLFVLSWASLGRVGWSLLRVFQ